MDVIKAIKDRTCVRAFLDKPVAKETMTQILECARFAPSGTNTQPWHVAVVQGQAKQRLSNAILAARKQGIEQHPDYHYYPEQWFEPYKSRRFECGMALYGALDIKREDKARRQAVWDLNYQFFGAPVGMIFYLDARINKGSWMDMGMFLQNIMLAARGVGLETCPQASLAEYPDIVRRELAISDQYHIVCGMALGYADTKHPINQYRTTRIAVDEFTIWYE